MKKRYLAIVDGIISLKRGEIINDLGPKRAYAGQTIWGEVPPAQGVRAITDWELLDQGSETSLVACYPKTGRTHQIRVHMAGMGHPILGDYQYGNRFKSPFRSLRTLLHAESIQLDHPLTQKRLLITAPLPDDFREAQRLLFQHSRSPL